MGDMGDLWRDVCDYKKRIAEIDVEFQSAPGWGSWMIMLANERENLVNALNRCGYEIEHKWLARCGTSRTD